MDGRRRATRKGIRGQFRVLLVSLAVVSWGAEAGARGLSTFAPELTYGVGAGAGFLGPGPGWEACPAGAGACRALGAPAGGGASLFVGLRVLDWLGLELGYDVLVHPGREGDAFVSTTLQSIRADARFVLPTDGWFEPYLVAGAAICLVGDALEAAGVGGGVEAGAGVELYLARVLSVGASVLYRGIGFGSFGVPAPEAATGEWTVGGGFVHGGAVRLDLTIHSVY